MLTLFRGHYTQSDFDLLAQIMTIEADNAIKERCELVQCQCSKCDCHTACADIRQFSSYVISQFDEIHDAFKAD